MLREPRIADFPDFAATQADAEVMRYISGGKTLGREDAWRKFMTLAGFWMMLGHGWWTVLEKETGAYVGYVGFSDFKRDIDGFDAPYEYGWTLASSMGGKGYATEAALAALDWGAERFPDARFTCLINQDNAASIRVAEKCGFRKFGQAQYKDAPVIFFERAARA